MSWSPVGVKGLLIKQGQNLKASVTHYQSNILSNFCHFYPYEEYSHLRSTLTLKLLITQHFQCGDTPSCSWCVPLLLLHFDIALIFYRKDAWHHGIYPIPQRNAECLSDISLWRRPLNQEQCLWLSCTDFTVVEA